MVYPQASSPVVEQKDHIASSRWQNEQDPKIPFNWPLRTRWTVTLLACYVTFIVGLNATSVTSAAAQLDAYFKMSDDGFPNSFWPVTSWTLGAAVTPMFILPIMEDHGVRYGYLAAYLTFFVFIFPQAFARNFATLVVTRFFAGCAGGVLQDSMDGIIADVWAGPVARSLPVTCYVFCLLAGVTSGSVLGGAVIRSLHWRWIFYIQLMICGASFPFVYLGIKEVRGHVILAAHGRDLHDSVPGIVGIGNSHQRPPFWTFVLENLLRPFYMLFTEPVVLFFTLLTALSYGLVFMSTVSVNQVYRTLYSWPDSSTSMVQCSILIGEVVGLFVCLFQNALFTHAFNAHATSANPALPEVRLYLLVPGSFFGLAGGLFWYGWTSYSYLPWMLPTVGLCLIGCGSMVVMTAVMMYLTDSYAKFAASASAAACFGENMFAAFLPLAAERMYTKLGFRWASSALGFIALALSFGPILLIWKGESIRRRSRFMTVAAYQ